MNWKEIKQKIHQTNISGTNRTQLVPVIREYLENHPENGLALTYLVFALYHGVIDTVVKENGDQMIDVHTKYPELNKTLNEAITISKQIIEKDPPAENRDTRNMRIYLAQIYSMLNDPKGETMSEENFKLHPNALYAERAGTNFLYFQKYKKSIEWFEKSVKLSEKEGAHRYPGLLQIAHTYYIIGDTENEEQSSKLALESLEKEEQNEEVKNAIKKGFFEMVKKYKE